MPVSVGTQIRLSEILGALSHALDLTEGQPVGHCIRACYIGMHIGREIGLQDAELNNLYYAVMLKDLGCSSNAARICQLYLADDRTFKRNHKQMGDRLPQVLSFVFTQTGMKAGLADRFRAIVNILQNGGEIARELIETRCQRGADIARQLRFGEDVANAIHSLDEHWNGQGKPQGLQAHAIPLFSRIALLSQIADVFYTSGGVAAAQAEVKLRRGSWFDPALVDAFLAVSSRPDFWQGLQGQDLFATVLTLEPARFTRLADEDYLDDIAAAFAQIVDSKSSFTHGHSTRVAVIADLIAEQLQVAPQRRRILRRAALLHDIGKLAVSNSILDKPGKLTDSEWQDMRDHAAQSEAILSRISVFQNCARIGGSHHERLDGKGYPRGLKAEHIQLDTRIITVADVFDALTADRPYRAGMSVAASLDIMRRDLGTAFDPDCFAALEQALDKPDQASKVA